MNFEQLAYVKKIYETESIVHASEAMHISQSAMSQSIANLEAELGYKLFDRSRKGTLPTEVGKKIIPLIIDILEAKTHLISEVDAMHSNIAGSLKIATIPTLFNKIIPKALSTFKKDYPHIEVEVIESDRNKIMKMVEDNEVDIGLIGKTESETFGQTIVSNSLNISTNFRLIVPKKSKLSLQDTVEMEAIQQYPFVLYDRNFYHHNFKQFEDENGPLKIVFRTNNPSVLIKTVSEGLGVSIVSSLMLEDDPFILNGLIEMLPIGAPFDYYIYFTAITHSDRTNEQTIRTFIDYLRK
ncbi:LysR family transcriptional regulator [Staphylococcus saprophyticus]|uniref:LysR family transcriptional regulator n=1 Tax=Staphylococcus saprophyticus TaxID=29385 RepID=UPI0007D95D07|nr:LysR family transcriptional regulator [Staphylococcus saprophyticus]MDW4099736.1 LysR family transcriptional regulator [Staphylococcus saprophyticus]MDW4158986.1 LysR family transcriptional regulator [Staphylococcus saprophyticus]MDW4161840.1 LysR family transcriptional regulator [Staphylococcus saprophyticus]MDW4189822.1 LysR family transcriptional regulator [Staphylococcus saprophyticus]MDW4356434.1 LysR family transcriptional regulator [Staphylococcus saprophyticus]